MEYTVGDLIVQSGQDETLPPSNSSPTFEGVDAINAIRKDADVQQFLKSLVSMGDFTDVRIEFLPKYEGTDPNKIVRSVVTTNPKGVTTIKIVPYEGLSYIGLVKENTIKSIAHELGNLLYQSPNKSMTPAEAVKSILNAQTSPNMEQAVLEGFYLWMKERLRSELNAHYIESKISTIFANKLPDPPPTPPGAPTDLSVAKNFWNSYFQNPTGVHDITYTPSYVDNNGVNDPAFRNWILNTSGYHNIYTQDFLSSITKSKLKDPVTNKVFDVQALFLQRNPRLQNLSFYPDSSIPINLVELQQFMSTAESIFAVEQLLKAGVWDLPGIDPAEFLKFELNEPAAGQSVYVDDDGIEYVSSLISASATRMSNSLFGTVSDGQNGYLSLQELYAVNPIVIDQYNTFGEISGSGLLFYDSQDSGSPTGTQLIAPNNLLSYDSNGDGVINLTDTAYQNMKLVLPDGTSVRLTDLYIESLSSDASGRIIIHYSDGSEAIANSFQGKWSEISAETAIAVSSMLTTIALPSPYFQIGGSKLAAAKAALSPGTNATSLIGTGSTHLQEQIEVQVNQSLINMFERAAEFLGFAKQSPNWDPLIIDLTGSGFSLSSSNAGRLLASGNEFLFQTAWPSLSASNGLLFLGEDNANALQNVDQIFGNFFLKSNGQYASDGFDALASLDSNADGVIDNHDDFFGQIRIIRADGLVYSLSDLGISSLSLQQSNLGQYDVFGNELIATALFERQDGSQGIFGDFNLVVNPRQSLTQNVIEESPEIAALPDAIGFGTVHSLRQAMLRDTTGLLQELVSAFVTATVPTSFDDLVEQIVLHWTGSVGINPFNASSHINAQILNVVNNFMGESFISSDGSEEHVGSIPAGALGLVYKEILDSVYGQLMFQTHLSELAQAITVETDIQTGVAVLNLLPALSIIESILQLDTSNGEVILAQFARSVLGMGIEQMSNWSDFKAAVASISPRYSWLIEAAGFKQVVSGSSDAERLFGTEIQPLAIDAGEASDVLVNNSFSSGLLYGAGGNDTIYSGILQDRISGGQGNDLIVTNTGQDTIVFNLADGSDVVDTRQYYRLLPVRSGDSIEFGAGISFSQLKFTPSGNNLLIEIEGTTDSILVLDQLNEKRNADELIELFRFADGVSIDFSSVRESRLSTTMLPSESLFVNTNMNLSIYGNDIDSTIYGGFGKTNIYSGNGNQIIYTGAQFGDLVLGSGTYEVHLGDGEQLISVGEGSATVFGGYFSNSFYLSPTSGNLIVNGAALSQTFIFEEGISHGSLNFSIAGQDLLVSGPDSQIVIRGQVVKDPTDLLWFEFADGEVLSWEDVASTLIHYGSLDNDLLDLSGSTYNNIINGLEGDDNIIGGFGDDTIILSDNDIANGGAGHNLFVISRKESQLPASVAIAISSAPQIIGESDKLSFEDGFYQSGTYFTAQGNDLLVTFRNSNQSVLIQGELDPNAIRTISQFEFATGVTLSLNDIVSSGFAPAAQDSYVYRSKATAETFELMQGDGPITILGGQYSAPEEGHDVLLLPDLALYSGVELSSDRTLGLTISLSGSNDTITITNQLIAGDLKRIEEFTFANGPSLTLDELTSLYSVQVNNSDSNLVVDRSYSLANETVTNIGDFVTILAGDKNNTINSSGQNVTIVAGQGDSEIAVSSGSATIDLRAGGDATVLIGQANQTIYDGSGNSVLQVTEGTASTTIYELTSQVDFVGEVELDFAPGIEVGDLTFTGIGKDLSISIAVNGQFQEITVKDWLNPQSTRIVNTLRFDSLDTSITDLLQTTPLHILISESNSIVDTHFASGRMIYDLEGSNNRLSIGAANNTVNISGSGNVIYLPTNAANTYQVNFETGGLDNTLFVGGGSSTITINEGTGSSRIGQFAVPLGGSQSQDHVVFGSGIDDEAITLTATAYDLTLHLNNAYNDSLTLINVLNPTQTKPISSFDFADSTSLSLNDLLARGVVFYEPNDFFTVGTSNWTFDKKVVSTGDYQKIYAGKGNDVIEVSGKNVTLYGNTGQTEFKLNAGMGAVNLYDEFQPSTPGTTDTLIFGQGVTLDNLVLSYNLDNDILVSFANSNDTVNLHGQLSDTNYKLIGQYEFNDGASVLTRNDLLAREFEFTIDASDTAFGHQTFAFREKVTVNGDNNLVRLSTGDNRVFVNGDNTTILQTTSSTAVVDVVVNGTNVNIGAGSGVGTYTLNQGMGTVVIDQTVNAGGTVSNDHIVFGAGISALDLRLSYSADGEDLIIGFNGSNDQVTIINELLANPQKLVADFTFADSSVFTLSELAAQGTFYFSVTGDNQALNHLGSYKEDITVSGNNAVISVGYGETTVHASGDDLTLNQRVGGSAVDLIFTGTDATINTGSGSATYTLNIGMGTVLINENINASNPGTYNDHMIFGAGINTQNIALTSSGTDLIISLVDSPADSVRITNALGSVYKTVEDFSFDGGLTLTKTQLVDLGFTYYLTADNSFINHTANTFNETIRVSGNNDLLFLSQGNSTVYASGNNTTINASSGIETIFLTGSNATINTGKGSATYHLDAGMGTVTISETIFTSDPVFNDHIVFGANIDEEDLRLSYSLNDLIIGFAGSNDVVRINQELASPYKKIVQDFTFADSTVLTLGDLLTGKTFYFTVSGNGTGFTHTGTFTEDITITGNSNVVTLGKGNTTVHVSGNSNTVNQFSNNFANVSIELTGTNASFSTGSGSTTFILNTGMGTVTIDERITQNTGVVNDHIVFGSGILASDVELSFSGNDLIITRIGTTDNVRIIGELATGYKTIGNFEFADSTVLTKTELLNLGFSFYVNTNDTTLNHSSQTYNEIVHVSGNNDVIYQSRGNSTVNISGTGTTVNTNIGTSTINLTGSNLTVNSSTGSSTIVLTQGMGTVLINETSSTGTNDHLHFASAIRLDDIRVYTSGSNLQIAFYDSSDTVTIVNELSGSNKIVGDFNFLADSTVLTKQELLDRGLTYDVNTSDSTVDRTAVSANEFIDIYGNNDLVEVGSGQVRVKVFGDDATVYAGTGANKIEVYGESATLYGSSGQTEFNINSGIGTVTIYDIYEPSVSGQHNSVTLDASFDADDIFVSYSGSDLIVTFEGRSEQIVLKNQYTSTPTRLTDLVFADSTVIDHAALVGMVIPVFNITDDNFFLNHWSSTESEIVNVLGNNDVVWSSGADSTINVIGDDAEVWSNIANTIINVSGSNSRLYGWTGYTNFQIADGIGLASIYDTYAPSLAGVHNIITLDSSYDAADLNVAYSGNNLILTFAGDTDTIVLYNKLTDTPNRFTDLVFADSTVKSHEDLLALARVINVSTDNYFLDHWTSSQNETVNVTGNNDLIYSSTGTSTINVSGENAVIWSNVGSTTINVTGGNSVLHGWTGFTDFQIADGIGLATIVDTYTPAVAGTHNTISLDASYDAEDLEVAYVGNDLIITFAGDTDSLVLKNKLTDTPNRFTDLVFSNSTVKSHEDLLALARVIDVSSDNYFLDHWTSSQNETVYVNGNNDLIYSSTGNSTIYVNGDDAVVWANVGNTTINLSGYNSRLHGWTGYTDFQITDGIGLATIYDNNAPIVSGTHNIVSLDSSFDAADLNVAYSGNNLIITFAGDTDTIVLFDKLTDSPNRFTDLVFADSTVKTHEDLLALARVVNVSTDNYFLDHWSSIQNETVNVTGNNALIYGSTGNSTINVSGDSAVVWSNVGSTTINVTGTNSVLYGWTGYTDFQIADGIGLATIFDTYVPAVTGTHNTISLDSSYDVADLTVVYQGADLIIGFAGDTDSIVLKNKLTDTPDRLTDLVFADSTVKTHEDLLALARIVNVSGDNFFLDHWTSTQNEIVNVTGNNDLIHSSTGNSTINVIGDDAVVWANAGTTTIEVTGSNASLHGWTGLTDFVLNEGIGTAHIYDLTAPAVSGTHNTVSFSSAFDPDDLSLSYSGSDLLLNFAAMTDTVVLHGKLTETPDRFTDLVFADSTVISHQDLLNLGFTFNVSSDGYFLNHWNSAQDETVNVLADNNIIWGSTGESVINVLGDNAEIWGNSGSVTMNVSGENTSLYAWTGDGVANLLSASNSFYSNAGKFEINVETEHGAHNIYQNYDKAAGDYDVLSFGSFVTDTEVSFFMDGDNLLIGYGDQSSDVVTIYNQGVSGRQVEKIALDDGQFLTDSEINQLISDMASYATQNSISFTSLSDVQSSAGLMNIISTAWHAA